MTIDIDPFLQQLQQLACQEENLAVIWLYGSRAKGSASSDSDYDLAVAFNTFPEDEWDRRLQPEILQQRWSDVLQQSWPDKLAECPPISVVDINNIPLPLAFSIIQQGLVLCVNDGLRLVREENRITSMWEVDYLWHGKNYG